jgi:hypothetical protein
VTLAAYEEVGPYLAGLSAGDGDSNQKRVLLDPNLCSLALFELLPAAVSSTKS